MTSIQIHEFSTGIRPQINTDGSWVSLGFTGQYMNTTIDPIPYAVERSIANKEFAVAEGAFSDQPAVIGRVVLDSENSGWSVVAIVSRGQDEKGRTASFYRYFLCEGQDNLWKILAQIEKYEQENGHKPIFNPSETKAIGEVNSTVVDTTKPQSNIRREWLHNSTSTPIIIPPTERYTLQEINDCAFAKANAQPVAWAFNAEALEKPWSFIVIQAASERAYQILQKAAANTPKVQTPLVVDEQALKSAIKSLMGSSTVKPDTVNVIVEVLSNNQINTQYWHTLFDGQGARNAISQKIYSPQMVRLLTLRALVIPQTLPEYLDWLKIKDSSVNKRELNTNIARSLEFQSNLVPFLSNITSIQNKLNNLFEQLIAYDPPENLLENIGEFCLRNLSNIALSSLYYKLAAYFASRHNKNIISDQLFQKAFAHNRGKEKLFDTIVFSKNYRREEGESIVPIPNVIVYVLLSFLLGGLGGFFLGGRMFGERQEMTNKPTQTVNDYSDSSQFGNNDNSDSTNPLATGNINNSITPIPKNKKSIAEQKFKTTTIPALNQVITDIEAENISSIGIKRQSIVEALKATLGNSNLDETILDSRSKINQKSRDEWINAIYSYQLKINTKDNLNQEPEGYISPSPKGKVINNYLKPDVKEELKKKNQATEPSGN